MEVLLLSENILVEEKIQSMIQKLGHEVFVNKSFLYEIERMFNFNFDICIISNTVSNAKVEKIISSSVNKDTGLIRICDSTFSSENLSLFDEVWISHDESLDNLKEKLERSKEKSTFKMNQKKQKTRNNLTVNDLHLSMNEQRVFSFLTANENNVLSRENICEYVWDKNYTDSRKSQLSSLIKRINEKMKSSSMSSYEVKTIWGKGYTYSKVNS